MRRLFAVLVIAGLLFGAAGCGTAKQAEDEKLTIGYSIDSLIIERWQRDRDSFVWRANELGADVLVKDAGGDVQTQIDQITQMIEEKIPVIVIVASDCYRLGEVVREAHNAGIKVLCYERLIQYAPVDLFVSTDSRQVGALMADCVRENVPKKGNVLCILGSPRDSNTEMFQEGFKERMHGSGMNLIRYEYAGDWVAEHAYEEVSLLLRYEQALDAVVCANDDLASQAFLALAEYQKADGVILTGQDAELSACQRIAEGTQTMTVYKPVEVQAEMAAEFAVELAEGEKPEGNSTVYNGSGNIQSWLIDPTAVTKDNLDEVIIDSGFHSRSQVYRNITEK